MCWYNLSFKKYVPVLTAGMLLVAVLQSCTGDKAPAAGVKYFDIKGYFKSDSARLNKLHAFINKTVEHNGTSETKKVHIDSWGNELSLFSSSDINKPAWRESYKVEASDGITIYNAKDPALKTQKIIIRKDHDKVKWMLIFNHTKNILYETKEKLSYFPDSLYLIEKSQHVKFLGTNFYRIKGFFN